MTGLPHSNDLRQLGLGPLMGIGTAGKYAGAPLIESALDSVKTLCLGMGSKVTEEIAAVKLALEMTIAETEGALLASMLPDDLPAALRDKGLRAINAGVNLTVARQLFPHLSNPEWAEKILLVQTWRRARLQVRLLSRFETDTGTPGLAALKLWEDANREIVDVPGTDSGTRDPGAEPELRDALLDDEDLLGQVLEMRARFARGGM